MGIHGRGKLDLARLFRGLDDGLGDAKGGIELALVEVTTPD
jgi:hypothetical protein